MESLTLPRSASRLGVPLHRNPTLRDGLAGLVAFLHAEDYSRHAIGRIHDFAAVNGTLAGCPELEPEDEAGAEAAFVDHLPELDLGSDAWDREDHYLDAELLEGGTHPWPIPAIGDEDDRPDPTADRFIPFVRSGLWDLASLPPLSGGSPESDAPFEPTAEDWEDYRRWMADVEVRDAIRRTDDARSPMWGYE